MMALEIKIICFHIYIIQINQAHNNFIHVFNYYSLLNNSVSQTTLPQSHDPS